MLELIRPKSVSVRPSALQNYLADRKAFDRATAAPAVQLIARDTFVAETAIKLDQMLIEVKSLGREIELVKGDIAELRDEVSGNHRFSEFIDREHKGRTAKLDDLAKRFDYLKSRFDAFDGNSKGDLQAFRSFEAVSRRLTELGDLEREFRDVSWKLKASAALFVGSVLAWVAVVAAF